MAAGFAARVAASPPAAFSKPPVSEYRPNAMLSLDGWAVSARTACSTEANGPRSMLATPSIPVSPARTSKNGCVANATSRPVSAIRIPAAARTARRPQRADAQALANPDSEAAASPMPRVRPIRNGERPRRSSNSPMSTAENPNPNARSPRAASNRTRSTRRAAYVLRRPRMMPPAKASSTTTTRIAMSALDPEPDVADLAGVAF